MSFTSTNGQRRSERLTHMKKVNYKEFSDFEQYVSDIVDRKIKFNPINEIIETHHKHVYPTREGSYVDYSKFFDSNESHDTHDDDDWKPYQFNTFVKDFGESSGKSHYYLRSRK